MNLLQKLSGFAKTFRSALLTRWRGFCDSELSFGFIKRTNSNVDDNLLPLATAFGLRWKDLKVISKEVRDRTFRRKLWTRGRILWIGWGQGGHNFQACGGWQGNTYAFWPPALRQRDCSVERASCSTKDDSACQERSCPCSSRTTSSSDPLMVHLYLQVNTTIAMRTPLLCTCASHCFAHARPIALHMRAPLYRARPQFANMHPGDQSR